MPVDGLSRGATTRWRRLRVNFSLVDFWSFGFRFDVRLPAVACTGELAAYDRDKAPTSVATSYDKPIHLPTTSTAYEVKR
jgi:hypothetical protein